MRHSVRHSLFKRCAGLAMAVAGLVLVVMSGPSPAQAQGEVAAAQDGGQAIYETNCAGCHADDGTGVAGRGRPLTGIAAQGDAATHIASVADGKGGMPAFGSRLSGEEIEQAVTYARVTFVEEAAASGGDTELAVTGVGTTGLTVLGFAMLVGGLQLVVFSKRRDA